MFSWLCVTLSVPVRPWTLCTSTCGRSCGRVCSNGNFYCEVHTTLTTATKGKSWEQTEKVQPVLALSRGRIFIVSRGFLSGVFGVVLLLMNQDAANTIHSMTLFSFTVYTKFSHAKLYFLASGRQEGEITFTSLSLFSSLHSRVHTNAVFTPPLAVSGAGFFQTQGSVTDIPWILALSREVRNDWAKIKSNDCPREWFHLPQG